MSCPAGITAPGGAGLLDTLLPIADPFPPTGTPAPSGPDDTDASDAALVEQARTGDREALEVLLRRHYDRIHAVCRRITGHPADAADAAQNTLIAVTRGLARFDSRSRFSSWAYRIAVNCSFDELRRRSRLPALSLDDPDGTAGLAVTSDEGPESAVTRVDIEWALRQLQEQFRAPVVLRDMCGLDYAEIAEVLQLAPGTVRSRIARGRAALARLLEPSGRQP